jgi:hypothetical protein
MNSLLFFCLVTASAKPFLLLIDLFCIQAPLPLPFLLLLLMLSMVDKQELALALLLSSIITFPSKTNKTRMADGGSTPDH